MNNKAATSTARLAEETKDFSSNPVVMAMNIGTLANGSNMKNNSVVAYIRPSSWKAPKSSNNTPWN